MPARLSFPLVDIAPSGGFGRMRAPVAARTRELHDIFHGMFDGRDAPVLLEDRSGVLVAQNGHGGIHDFGENGSVEAVLGASFQHARSLEHRLRQGVRSHSKFHEIAEDRTGCLQRVELCQFGSDYLVWSISPESEGLQIAPIEAMKSSFATIQVDSENIVSEANEAAMELGLNAGRAE